MKKCIASQEGICRNLYGLGTKCSGYSEGCKFKKHYDTMSDIIERQAELARKAFRMKGDVE